jgi:hypothetical protein
MLWLWQCVEQFCSWCREKQQQKQKRNAGIFAQNDERFAFSEQ